jgi:hypothetical protein
VTKQDEKVPDAAEEALEGTAEELPANPDDYKPGELVPVDEPDYFKAMSLADEQQVLDELQGRALDAMLYSFPQDGKTVTGFSWVGIRESVRTLNARGYTRIRIVSEPAPQFREIRDEEGVDAIECMAYAVDERTGGGQWGIAKQPLEMKLKGGKRKPDPFCRTKALSKAQRNAYEGLIPLELREYLKAQFEGRGQVQHIRGAGEPDERPPALTDERATKTVAQIQAQYDELKKLNRLLMPPGQFNALLTAAQHDHARLDNLLDHLADLLANERDLRRLYDDILAGNIAGVSVSKDERAKLDRMLDEAPSQADRLAILKKVAPSG